MQRDFRTITKKNPELIRSDETDLIQNLDSAERERSSLQEETLTMNFLKTNSNAHQTIEESGKSVVKPISIQEMQAINERRQDLRSNNFILDIGFF